MSEELKGTETGAAGAERTVPYDRFQSVVSERNELKARYGDLEKSVQSLTERSATADTLAAQLRAEQTRYEQAQQEWTVERAVIGAGISDPDGIDAVKWAYGRVAPDDKGARPELTTWLSDREKLPKAVLAYLPQPTEQKQNPRPPAANAGVKPYTGAPSQFSAEAIAHMSPEEYKAQRAAIMTNIRR